MVSLLKDYVNRVHYELMKILKRILDLKFQRILTLDSI
jgi:hypothetical protein